LLYIVEPFIGLILKIYIVDRCMNSSLSIASGECLSIKSRYLTVILLLINIRLLHLRLRILFLFFLLISTSMILLLTLVSFILTVEELWWVLRFSPSLFTMEHLRVVSSLVLNHLNKEIWAFRALYVFILTHNYLAKFHFACVAKIPLWTLHYIKLNYIVISLFQI
jgi:hypothetical protein